MSTATETAIQKLEKEHRDAKYLPVVQSCADATLEAVKEFCCEETFAEAVNRSEQKFPDILNNALAETLHRCRQRGHGESVSAVQVFGAIVKAYLPAAEIRAELRIVLPDKAEEPPEQKKATILSLFDL